MQNCRMYAFTTDTVPRARHATVSLEVFHVPCIYQAKVTFAVVKATVCHYAVISCRQPATLLLLSHQAMHVTHLDLYTQ